MNALAGCAALAAVVASGVALAQSVMTELGSIGSPMGTVAVYVRSQAGVSQAWISMADGHAIRTLAMPMSAAQAVQLRDMLDKAIQQADPDGSKRAAEATEDRIVAAQQVCQATAVAMRTKCLLAANKCRMQSGDTARADQCIADLAAGRVADMR